MSRANNSSVEMDDGIKAAYLMRTQKNTFGAKTDINDNQKSGERKQKTAAEKAKAKKKAKLAKASRKKNK